MLRECAAKSGSIRNMTTVSVTRRGAVFSMLAATLCWSSGGVLAKSVAHAGAMEAVFWRSLFMAGFVAVLLSWRGDRTLWRQLGAADKWGHLAGLSLASTFFFFILSLRFTHAANTFALMATAPLFTAVLARCVLGERLPLRTSLALLAAVTGMVLIFADSWEGGRSLGNLLALGVPAAYAVNLVALRRHHVVTDPRPTLILAGLYSMLFAAPFAWPPQATSSDVVILAVMGCGQLAAGCLFMLRAVKVLQAAEVSLLGLLETVLGPLWVWLILGEAPGRAALTGAVVVITALAANELAALSRPDPSAIVSRRIDSSS
jgi:drug/metabolite transporter (DMT)-like permease